MSSSTTSGSKSPAAPPSPSTPGTSETPSGRNLKPGRRSAKSWSRRRGRSRSSLGKTQTPSVKSSKRTSCFGWRRKAPKVKGRSRTTSSATTAAAGQRREKPCGSALNARTSCCAASATSSSCISISWRRGRQLRALGRPPAANRPCSRSKAAEFAGGGLLPIKSFISILTAATS